MNPERTTSAADGVVRQHRLPGMRVIPAAVIAIAAAATLVGCSSDSDTGSAGATSGLTGDPIDIMVNTGIDTAQGNFIGDVSGAEAAALQINSTGGVNGRPINIITCNNLNTTDGATECGRQAVTDRVAAVVGTNAYGQVVYPTLEAASIPSSFFAISSLDLQTETNFPINGSGWSTLVAQGLAAKEAGVKKVGIVCLALPGQDVLCDNAKIVARNAGLEVAAEVEVSFTTTTFGPQIEQLKSSGADGVLYFSSAPQLTPMIQAATSVGFEPTWISALGIYPTPELLADVSRIAPDLWVTSAFPPVTSSADYPGIAAYIDQMAAAGASGIEHTGIDDQNETSIHAWAAVHGFADIARTVSGEVEAASLLAAVKTAKNIDLQGLQTWSPGATPPLANYPGLHDYANVYIGRVEDGIYTPNPKDPVSAAAGVTLK